MEVAYKQSFEKQRKKYRFCFTCDHCAHFDELKGECIHGFPNEQHLLKRYTAAVSPPNIMFCKDFDLA